MGPRTGLNLPHFKTFSLFAALHVLLRARIYFTRADFFMGADFFHACGH